MFVMSIFSVNAFSVLQTGMRIVCTKFTIKVALNSAVMRSSRKVTQASQGACFLYLCMKVGGVW